MAHDQVLLARHEFWSTKQCYVLASYFIPDSGVLSIVCIQPVPYRERYSYDDAGKLLTYDCDDLEKSPNYIID